MKPKYTNEMVVKKGQFIGRPIEMGKKKVIIIPTEFHGEFKPVMNKLLKFSWEEILDSK